MKSLAFTLAGSLFMSAGIAGIAPPGLSRDESRTMWTIPKSNHASERNFDKAQIASSRRLTALAQSWAVVIQKKADLTARIAAAKAAASASVPNAGQEGLTTQFDAQWSAATVALQGWNIVSAQQAVAALDLTTQQLVASDALRRETLAAQAAQAAAQAATQAAARASAHAATQAQAKAAPRPPVAAPKPAAPKPAAPNPAAQAVKWSTFVGNHGGQSAVDACTGGLTRWSDNLQGRPYLPIHRACGGAPILSLRTGDLVRISGGGLDGVWRVVSSKDIPKRGAGYDAAAGVAGTALLQTCYRDDSLSRLVGIARH